jgi:hypothetical protein
VPQLTACTHGGFPYLNPDFRTWMPRGEAMPDLRLDPAAEEEDPRVGACSPDWQGKPITCWAELTRVSCGQRRVGST